MLKLSELLALMKELAGDSGTPWRRGASRRRTPSGTARCWGSERCRQRGTASRPSAGLRWTAARPLSRVKVRTEVASWLKSFRVVDLYAGPNEKKPKVRAVYGIKGSLRVVPASALEAEMAQLDGAADPEAMGAWAKRWVNCWPEQQEFEPEPGVEPAGRIVGVQEFLTSVLCLTGATCWAGKATRGELARKLSKRANLKGRGDETR